MKKFFLLPFIIFTLAGSAQTINLVSESDIPGITILPAKSYTREDIDTYRSRDPNLCREYGFTKLFVNDYLFNQNNIRVEVYVMENAASAFGLYSVSIPPCTGGNPFGTFSCSTPNQVSAANGKLFISARNRTGTQPAQALCEKLVKLIKDANPQDIWYAPPIVQSEKAAPFTSTLHYYKGPAALAKVLPAWSEMFDNVPFHMFTMNVNFQDYSGILSRISFPDESSLGSFLMKSELNNMPNPDKPVRASNGLYRSWFRISSTKLLFFETNSLSASIKDFVPKLPDNKWLEEE